MSIIWCNMAFPPAARQHLVEGVAGHTLLFPPTLTASNLVSAPPDPQLAEAEIVFGQPAPEAILAHKNVRWVHLTSAGYERYDTPEFRHGFGGRGGMLTNSSAVYADPCAEHALSMMLALARQLPQSLDEQRTTRAWSAPPIRANSRLLLGQSVLILGYGSIARRLVELLQPLRMKITAVRRKPRGNEAVPTVAQEEVERHLPQADHVINILPGGPSTVNFMTAKRFALMKPTAHYYSVGRGPTTDQAALLDALSKKQVAAAYLDVTTPEPLPENHPLWKQPNCFITPHTAGGHHDEHVRLVDHFLGNLKRWAACESLVDLVL